MRRWILITLVIVIALPAAAIALVATESGSRWLVGMASRMAGERVTYESVRGNLVSELRISMLKVHAAGHRANVDHVVFRWRPLALLGGRVHVQHLALTNVDYAAPEALPQEAPVEAPTERVAIPVAIQLDDARVENVVIRRGDEQDRVDRIALQGFSVDGEILTLTYLEVAADALSLTAHGRADPSPPHALEVGVAWSFRLPDGNTAGGVGNLSGSLDSINFEHRLDAPFRVDLAGAVAPTSKPLRLNLEGQWRDLRWPLEGPADIESASGDFRAEGNLSDLDLVIDAAVSSATIPARRFRIDANGGIAGDGLRTSLQWTAVLSDSQEVTGRANLSGNAARLDVDHTLVKPVHVTTRGYAALSGATPEISFEGEWRDLGWPLVNDRVAVSDSGRYRISGALDALKFDLEGGLRSKAAQIERMDLKLEGEASAAAPFPFAAKLRYQGTLTPNIETEGRASIRGDQRAIALESTILRPMTLETRGDIALDPPAPRVDLRGQWKDLRWPFSGDPEFESAAGEFSVVGPVSKLAVKLKGKSGGIRLPAADLALDAEVQPNGAQIKTLNAKTLGGDVRVAGEVGWQPVTRWQLDVAASNLRPEQFFSEWPGQISLNARVAGSLEKGTPQVSVDGLKLEGQLRGYPVEGDGAIRIVGSRVTAPGLRLRSGDNRLEVQGEAGDRLDLRFMVDAPALDAVAPGLGGRLKSEGTLAGTRTEPRISAKLSGSAVAWRDNRVESLTVDIDAGTAPGYRSRVVLDARDIRLEGEPLGRVSLSGEGTPDAHRAVLDASGRAGTVTARASGRFSDGRWSGTLDLDLETKDFGDWRMPAPAPLSASREQLRVERACLAQPPGRVCVSGRWQANGNAVQASGEIVSLPLALARALLPGGMEVAGPLDAEFKLGGTLEAPEAEARMEAPAGTISYQPGADFPGAEFGYREARMSARHAPAGTRLETSVVLENVGRIRGILDIGAFRRDRPAPLNGRVEADFSDLSWLGVVVPQLVEVRGQLDAALDIGGTTANPAVNGTLALENGEANVPDLGLELREIGLAIRNETQERIVLQGGLTSGGGRLDIAGRSELFTNGERRVDLEIKGKDVEAVRLPTVHAFITPDLRLSADPKIAELSGSVHIPRAQVKLRELPQSAIKVSEDEIIVDANGVEKTRAARAGPVVRLKVDLSLGDAVTFDGFGLSTGIEGNLAVSGETGQPPRAQGTLTLREGRYEAYGQDLKIRTGRLLFAGPTDNPGIDLTAVREVEDITAGIVVSGNVKSINSRVFSEPPLPEAEAFSYLLTGRPLSGGTPGDAAMLQEAATALGLKRAQMVTQQIGEMLGLDELTVGGKGVDQASLLLGKRITPDLVVRYALGVFDQTGKLLLNYRLTESISVQAESGEHQGMDVIYKIER